MVEMTDVKIPISGVYPISQLHNLALQAAYETLGSTDINIRTRQTDNTFRIILERRSTFSDEFGEGVYGFPAAVVEVPAIQYGHAGRGYAVVSKNLDRFDFDYPFLGLSLEDGELAKYADAFSRRLKTPSVSQVADFPIRGIGFDHSSSVDSLMSQFTGPPTPTKDDIAALNLKYRHELGNSLSDEDKE